MKTDDDVALMSPPPPGPQGTLLDGAGPLGIKVFPRVDPQLLESAVEMNVGPKGRGFPHIPGLPCSQNILLHTHYISLGNIKVLQGVQVEGFSVYTVCYFL